MGADRQWRAADHPVPAGKHVLVHEREQPFAEILVGTEMLEPQEQGGDVVPGPDVQLDGLDVDFADLGLVLVRVAPAATASRWKCGDRSIAGRRLYRSNATDPTSSIRSSTVKRQMPMCPRRRSPFPSQSMLPEAPS